MDGPIRLIEKVIDWYNKNYRHHIHMHEACDLMDIFNEPVTNKRRSPGRIDKERIMKILEKEDVSNKTA